MSYVVVTGDDATSAGATLKYNHTNNLGNAMDMMKLV
jgi:hypothetical protein